MKKIMTILLAAILLATFVGCSGSSDGGGTSGNNQNNTDSTYATMKDIYRTCNGEVNTSILSFYDFFDTDFYNTDASRYQSYMNYGQNLFSACEDIFSGNNEDIKKSLEQYIDVSDADYRIDGGKATITGKDSDGADVEITVEYDGASTAQVVYKANGEITKSGSFITNDKYSIIVYSEQTITAINAVYKNGDSYYAYDVNGTSKDFSVYNGSFDDPSSITSNRPYIAVVGGSFVNNSDNA